MTEQEVQSLFNELLDANNLVHSFNKSKKGVDWKESVQRYEANILKNTNRLVKELRRLLLRMMRKKSRFIKTSTIARKRASNLKYLIAC